MRLNLLLLLLLLLLISNVYCYSQITHKYLGQLTDNYLKNEPFINDKIMNILDNNSISNVSTWADKIKRTKKYGWTSSLHYIDIMECKRTNYNYNDVNKYCNNKCIVSTIIDFSNKLKNKQCNLKENEPIDNLNEQELLKFLIHFNQDFNQPMHLLGYERGGNSLKINITMPNGKIKNTNLHFLWDSILPEFYIKNKSNNKQYSVLTISNEKLPNILLNILNDNIQIGCKIYPNSSNIIFNDYYKKEYFDILFTNYERLINYILGNFI